MRLPIAAADGPLAVGRGPILQLQDRAFPGQLGPLCTGIDESAERSTWLAGVMVLSLSPSTPQYSDWLEMAGAQVCPAESPASAIEAVESGRPYQVLLIDALLLGECGLAVAEQITTLKPWCRVVVISQWVTAPVLKRAQRLPNASVITRNLSQSDFILSLLSASRCTACLLHTLAGQIARRSRLSPQQARLLWLNLWGYSDQEIGSALGIQLHTVQDYQLTLRRKTGVRSKAAYLRLLLEYLGTPAPLGTPERGVDSGMFPTQSRQESG